MGPFDLSFLGCLLDPALSGFFSRFFFLGSGFSATSAEAWVATWPLALALDNLACIRFSAAKVTFFIGFGILGGVLSGGWRNGYRSGVSSEKGGPADVEQPARASAFQRSTDVFWSTSWAKTIDDQNSRYHFSSMTFAVAGSEMIMFNASQTCHVTLTMF